MTSQRTCMQYSLNRAMSPWNTPNSSQTSAEACKQAQTKQPAHLHAVLLEECNVLMEHVKQQPLQRRHIKHLTAGSSSTNHEHLC
jgi:hypothetical protein